MTLHQQERARRQDIPDPPGSALEIIERFENHDHITDHPYFHRLRREPANLTHLWKLLANFQISISKNFARRLARILARVEDARVLCILAEQLNDEMGDGNFERAHINLFANMMSRLEPWRPVEVDESVFTPGRRLDPRLAEIYEADDIYECLGALMVGEIFGKQMDKFIADEFRRQVEVDPASLEWLILHEELEVSHADSSADLARLIPSASIEATWKGAVALSRAGRGFLDDLHVLCYSPSA
jgi:pyrroloquinoline quinone (PQQ) biosynthesis protein C